MDYVVIKLDERGWEPLMSYGPFASRGAAMQFSRSINAQTVVVGLMPIGRDQERLAQAASPKV